MVRGPCHFRVMEKLNAVRQVEKLLDLRLIGLASFTFAAPATFRSGRDFTLAGYYRCALESRAFAVPMFRASVYCGDPKNRLAARFEPPYIKVAPFRLCRAQTTNEARPPAAGYEPLFAMLFAFDLVAAATLWAFIGVRPGTVAAQAAE